MNPDRVRDKNKVSFVSESPSKTSKTMKNASKALKRARNEVKTDDLESELYSTPKKASTARYDSLKTKADSLELDIKTKKINNSSADKEIVSAAASVENNMMPFYINEESNRAIQGIEHDYPGERQCFYNPMAQLNSK